jgi:hypothetical protein
LADEHSLIQTASKAKKAEGLLDNELFNEASPDLSAPISRRGSKTQLKTEGRERCSSPFNVIGKVRDHQ